MNFTRFEDWRDHMNRSTDTGYTERDAFNAGLHSAPAGFQLVRLPHVVGNPKVDWGVAPTWAKYWLVDGSSGKAWWCSKRPRFSERFEVFSFCPNANTEEAPWFDYEGSVRKSITYRRHMEG